MEWYQDNDIVFKDTLFKYFLDDKYDRIIYKESKKALIPDPETLPNWHYTISHCHSGIEILFVLKGVCLFEYGDKYFLLHENDIAVTEKGINHRERILSENNYYTNVYLALNNNTVRLSVTKYSEDKIHKYCPAAPTIVLDDEALVSIICSEIENKQKNFESFFYAHLKSLYFYLYRCIFIKDSGYSHLDYESDLINMINFYIEHNINGDINTKDISLYFKLNESYLCKIYKKHTEFTLSNHINSMRIRNAIYLLGNTDRRIVDIAFDVGYNDQYYFSKIFKKSIGVSPSAYRNNIASSKIDLTK